MEHIDPPPPPLHEAHHVENADNVGPGSPSIVATSTRDQETADPDKREPNDVINVSPSQLLSEVDEFLGAAEEDSVADVPKSMESLSDAVNAMIEKYSTGDNGSKFGADPELDSSFFDSIDRLSKLTDRFEEFASAPIVVNKVSAVLQRSMSFLEDELRAILETSISTAEEQSPTHHISSTKSFKLDRCAVPEPDPKRHSVIDFSVEDVTRMNRIAKSMISAGYENECRMVYGVLRRNALKSALTDLGFEIVSIEELQTMQWESLEGEVTSWIKTIREFSTNLLPKEHTLCFSIFPDNHGSVLFADLINSLCIRFLDFAEAILLTKQSVEKLFKMLDMYEAVRDLTESVPGLMEELRTELLVVKNRLAEAASNMFDDLENSIKSDGSRTPVPGGAVHPLTWYTMNYLIYACDQYKDTLEQVFQTARGEPGSLAVQFTTVTELLDANLDMKSRLYKDPSLRLIFLMNNGRYILQKIKGSVEIRELMGDTWYRKRSSALRGYHKSYQRETWFRLLQCLSHEKLQVNGKVSKPVLKERFKSFNTMFEEIHKSQSTWVVSDEQLQSELRVSIAAVVTPAYRSFLGRFNQYLDPGRQTEKYVKYQPEDIETLIEDLFAGNPNSMARRRT